MFSIEATDLPEGALLNRYRNECSEDGSTSYTDCYSVSARGQISLSDYVFAFYTSPAFKAERFILAQAVAKPSTDDEARALADGTIDRFSAWTVEDRTDSQLLMCDYRGRTRSWFMVTPLQSQPVPVTQLRFGSAVVPDTDTETGERVVPAVFRALLGFHQIYSRVLLQSAKMRVERNG